MIKSREQIDTVRELLEDYARRGVFRSFSAGPVRGSKATFRMIWHRNRPFELVADFSKGELRFVHLLPELPADSPVYRDLKAFVKARQCDELPAHRRIDRTKAQVRTYNRQGDVSLVLKLVDNDFDYGTRKLVLLGAGGLPDISVRGAQPGICGRDLRPRPGPSLVERPRACGHNHKRLTPNRR